MLPKIPHENGAVKIPLDAFGGLDRRVAAGNGAICAMTNLSSDDLPVLASRKKRATYMSTLNLRGMFGGADRLYSVMIGSTTRYRLYAGQSPMSGPLLLDDSAERVFASLGPVKDQNSRYGERVLFWPDKYIMETYSTYQALEQTVTLSCYIEGGTYAGEAAEGNTIRADSATYNWSSWFKVGDAVTISGATTPENNRTSIIREIEGNELHFYENTFVSETGAQTLTVARTVPDLDFICVNDNRVWGCKGDTIRCCKLGDPYNWNVFDGLSTDAWSVETGTPGKFTGCISFMGYPIFFKEDRVFKVYGNKPSNFEVISSATLGVLQGAHKTMAVAGETLYYLSRAGFVRYNGGYPSAVDEALNTRYTGGVAGSDGRKYYVSAIREDGARELLVYDPAKGVWHREDDVGVSHMAFSNGKLYAAAYNDTEHWSAILELNAQTPDEEDFSSSVTFADFDLQTFASKYPVRLWLRYESDEALTVKISYNGGAMETVTTLPAGNKGTKYTPVPIRRCDRFGLEISTTGAWKLYAMEIETRTERTNRKGG